MSALSVFLFYKGVRCFTLPTSGNEFLDAANLTWAIDNFNGDFCNEINAFDQRTVLWITGDLPVRPDLLLWKFHVAGASYFSRWNPLWLRARVASTK